MPITRRGLLGATVAAGAAGLLAGCTGTPVTATTAPATPSRNGKPLTFGLTYTPDVQFAPAYVAQTNGYFSAEGLSVTLRHHGASETLFGALAAGQEDVVFAGGDEMMQARSEKTDVIDFFTLYQTHPVVLIVPADSPINSSADIRGKKIGVPGPYGETYMGLLALLKQANLQTGDVEIQNIGYTQLAAMQSKRVDAVMGFANNDAVRLSQGGFKNRQIPLGEDVPLVGVGLGTSDGLLAQHQDHLTSFAHAFKRGVEFCRQDPEQTLQIVTKFVPGLTDETDLAAARATLMATLGLYGDKIGAQDDAKWKAMSKFMSQVGLVSTRVRAEEAYTAKISDVL